MRLRRFLLLLGAVAVLLAPAPVRAAEEQTRDCFGVGTWSNPLPVCIGEASYFDDVCSAIAKLAAYYALPDGYLARLFWQESQFDPSATSWAGAQGIAQFIPSTARIRGVQDPYRPAEALSQGAAYLRFLTDKFGNLGLAAAAYNGGENRVARYQAAGGYLPAETRNYVQIVTGLPVEQWLAEPVAAVDYSLDKERDFHGSCVDLANGRPLPQLQGPSGPWKPWGVQIAQNFSAAVASASFERARAKHSNIFGDEAALMLTVRNPAFGSKLRHSAMLGRDSRKEAQALCAELTKAGGSCIVVKN